MQDSKAKIVCQKDPFFFCCFLGNVKTLSQHLFLLVESLFQRSVSARCLETCARKPTAAAAELQMNLNFDFFCACVCLCVHHEEFGMTSLVSEHVGLGVFYYIYSDKMFLK